MRLTADFTMYTTFQQVVILKYEIMLLDHNILEAYKVIYASYIKMTSSNQPENVHSFYWFQYICFAQQSKQHYVLPNILSDKLQSWNNVKN